MATIIRKDYNQYWLRVAYLFGGHVRGGSFAHCSLLQILTLRGSSGDQPKVSNFYLFLFLLAEHDVFRLRREEQPPQVWCLWYLAHVLMVSTLPSDPCGLNYWSGCTQLHWLFVGKLKDFPFSSPGIDFHSFFLSVTWGFQWNTAPSGYRDTWVMNPCVIWTVNRTRQSDICPKAQKRAQFQSERSLCAELLPKAPKYTVNNKCCET